MINNIKELKVNLLKFLVETFPELPPMMRNTLHSFSFRNPNKYHLEDDVWSHTLLVFNEICRNDKYNLFSLYPRLITALMHDVGKIFSRNNSVPGKVGFFGHEEASIQYAAEFCYKLNESLFSTVGVSNEILRQVISVIGVHDRLYNLLDKKENLNVILNLLNMDPVLVRLFLDLYKADCSGQYSTVDNEGNDVCIDLLQQFICDEINYNKFVGEDECDVWLYCGVPGSGKDYLAKRDGFNNILSWDSIRLNKYLDNNIGANEKFNTKVLYNLSYEYCERNKVNLNSEIRILLKQFNIPRLVICNTNTTIKNRSIINIIKEVFGVNVKIGCRFIFSNYDSYIKRDLERIDKTVGKEVIDKFVYKIQVPTLNEGFSRIDYIYNEY